MSFELKKNKPISTGSIVAYFFILLTVLIINYPFFWMIMTSLKTNSEVFNSNSFFPQDVKWGNYAEAWKAANWSRYFMNSFIFALIPVAGQIFFGSLAANAFTKEFKGSKILFTLFLGTMMIPVGSIMVPNYVIVKNLGWLNTYNSMTVPFLSSAFSIFLLRQHFMTIPKELEDAAIMDGAGYFYYLFRIIMPLSVAPMLTVGLLTFMGRWNDFVWVVIMTTSEKLRTVQLGLTVFRSDWNTEWGNLMAACTFISIPVILLFLTIQKKYINGLMLGSVKG